jgi:methylated-DNA-[protein]-cysteine S-methyltransferase
MWFHEMPSPIGALRLVGDDAGLRRIEFLTGDAAPLDASWREDRRALAPARAQLEEYFAGDRVAFGLELAPDGTPFQQRVWQVLLEIPHGETRSYGWVAQRLGQPTASRAVGLANGRNPLPIVIPCHRVIGASGRLVGYGGGLATKEALLALERGQLELPAGSAGWAAARSASR